MDEEQLIELKNQGQYTDAVTEREVEREEGIEMAELIIFGLSLGFITVLTAYYLASNHS